MPCQMDIPENNEKSNLENMLCRLLTAILIDYADIDTIKNEAMRGVWWLKEHLSKDIEKCEEELAKSWGTGENERWSQKVTKARENYKKAKNLYFDSF